MRMVKCCLMVGLTLGLLGLALPSSGEEKEKPKYTIKEVMKEAHKSGLMKKVASGKADKADQEKLAEMYAALAKNKPPQGEAKSWGEKTEALIKASKDVLAGKKGAGAELTKAANCMACHSVHKPK